jgi:hypothetical protein
LPLISRVSSLGQFGAVARGREESADASARRANALGQIALGGELELDFSAAIQAIKNVTVNLARKAANDLAHPPGLEQRGQARLAIARIVVDDDQIARPLRDQSVDQFVGNARGPKAANEHGGSVWQAGQCGLNGWGNLVDHGSDLLGSAVSGVGRDVLGMAQDRLPA